MAGINIGDATGLGAIANFAKDLADRFLPDKAANDAAKAQIAEMQLSGQLQAVADQVAVNKVEAASNSVFVAGWRPAVGWVCAIALFSNMIVAPFMTFAAALLLHKSLPYPQLDLNSLLTLLGNMLGFGIMRSVDKAQGTGNGH